MIDVREGSLARPARAGETVRFTRTQSVSTRSCEALEAASVQCFDDRADVLRAPFRDLEDRGPALHDHEIGHADRSDERSIGHHDVTGAIEHERVARERVVRVVRTAYRR